MIQTRRHFLRQTAAITAASCMVHPIKPLAEEWTDDVPSPNILMILTDDQGWGDLSISGNKNLSTPNIDSLSHAGATIDRFYVCPVCSPTRAEMLTGRYNTRLGVTSTSSGGERFNADEKTIGDTFKAAGYATSAYGKWHSGMQWPYHPNARGFDDYYGFCSGHWGNYFSPTLDHNGKLVKGKGFVIDDFTEHAMDFIKKNKKKPFFCYLPYNTPHSPMQVPNKFWEKFEDADLEMRHMDPKKEDLLHTQAALAMCENIDWNVGRLLKQLDKLGIADNTIVIYFSDNGPNGWRWNNGMKGKKGSTDEGGVRSPFFIRWPRKIEAGTKISQIAGAIDLLPTLADICDIPTIGEKKLDGISIKPLLLGTKKSLPERMYFNAWKKKVSVRTQKYRLDYKGNLYDMESDPGQLINVSKKHPDVTAKLKKAVEEFKKNTMVDTPKRPFTVGHPNSPVTHLPARDGQPSGNIKRSCRHPNDSFFTNWSSKDDSITWDIEVLTAGKYDAEIYYTCKKENVGSEIELSFGTSKTKCKIKKAHDPALIGAENDRFPRGEGYVKDFKPLDIGTLEMKKERGTLTLSALNIPGAEAIDLRYVILKRK